MTLPKAKGTRPADLPRRETEDGQVVAEARVGGGERETLQPFEGMFRQSGEVMKVPSVLNPDGGIIMVETRSDRDLR